MPVRTMSDLYPAGVAFSGFAPAAAARWVTSDLQARLSLMGPQLPVRGSMQMLCSAGVLAGAAVVADLAADLLELNTDGISSFSSEAEYAVELQRLTASGVRVVTQHRHPDDLLPPAGSWIPPTIQGDLNDKGGLAALVPEHGRPRRQVGDPRNSAWIATLREGPFPIMLKAATRSSTGGGTLDVQPCFTAQDLPSALAGLADSERLVAEEWIDDRARHLCVNAVVLPNGDTAIVGSAEVVSSAEGTYLGNWLGDIEARSTTEDLVSEIAQAGGALGYRGLLGVDVAELPDGSTLAYDLNFRLCGSTAPLLVAPTVLATKDACVARMQTWLLDRPLLDAARLLERARPSGLIPLAVFDPAPHGLSGPVRVASLVRGSSRQDVEEQIRGLHALFG